MRRHDLQHLGVVEPGYALHLGNNDHMERVVIKVRHNGPYKVTGPITLIDADENEYDIGQRGETIVLCRCGGSQSKPFCDGTHKQIGFQAGERSGGRRASGALQRAAGAQAKGRGAATRRRSIGRVVADRSQALLSPAGAFANGVTAVMVVQLILDYEESARLDDVASYFDLTTGEVEAALDYCSRHFERLRAEGRLVR